MTPLEAAQVVFACFATASILANTIHRLERERYGRTWRVSEVLAKRPHHPKAVMAHRLAWLCLGLALLTALAAASSELARG
ncbi:MAG: hypothetical protein INH41_14790 [Myxococcaceae bacterium]|jgi:hypothetical protein|nr:hypothetical protein [Myxococcaceae bacterium]MCA3013646.1 hypothetical protein [Myxococcaceae bacterium]